MAPEPVTGAGWSEMCSWPERWLLVLATLLAGMGALTVSLLLR